MLLLNNEKAKPFIRWAGGKTGLLEQFKSLYPRELKAGEITTYIEPFLRWWCSFNRYTTKL